LAGFVDAFIFDLRKMKAFLFAAFRFRPGLSETETRSAPVGRTKQKDQQ
jgi:hypothetical protein